ncbi:MAG: SurA N-terminal domain-containing protein [Armatimonadetes bacterium]|nr:SurA N-terminal domain-containing protein [Armatimonadota bacterium]
MRRTAYWWAIAVAVVAAIVFVIAGCGTKTTVVPDVVAKVNGQEISGSDYLDQAHRAAGRQVLSNLIEQSILVQWAKDEGVPVTDEQVNKAIESLKRDGIYDEQLKYTGEAGLKALVQSQQARANLVNKMAKPSDEETKSAYEMMKTRYVHGPRRQVAVIINNKKAKIEDAAKRIKDGEDFDTVAIDCSAMGSVKLWLEKNQPMVPPELLKAAWDTKVGEVSGPVNVSMGGQPTQWVVLKVLKDQPKVDLAFKDVKEEVETAAAAQKFQQDPEFGRKLNEKKKEAKIEIELADYKEVAAQFKNPPEPMPGMGMPQRVRPQAKPAPKSAKP